MCDQRSVARGTGTVACLLPGYAMSHDIHAMAVGTVQDLDNHDTAQVH
jgi:hypothetical protein